MIIKKIFALVMAMLLAFSAAAFAEEFVYEPSYDGAWAELEYGLAMYVPADWYYAELTEEQIEKGIFAFFTNEEFTETLQLSATAIDANVTLESVAAGLAQVYNGVAIAELPNGSMVTYADYENGVFSALTIDGEAGLLYTLNFMPYSEEFAELAVEILCSFGYIAIEE